MKEYKYRVQLREVHINHVEVYSDVPLTDEEALEQASDASVDSSVYVEYSHQIKGGPDIHTVELVEG